MSVQMSKVKANIAEYAVMVGISYSKALQFACNGGYAEIIQAIHRGRP